MSLRISGNRLLQTLPGSATRPTSARVRQALFNILQGQVAGSRWLDLCSGSGSIGAEALCQGARSVVGIDLSAAACRIIEANWQKVAQPDQQFQVMRGDAKAILLRGLAGDPFEFVYLDPPYDVGLYEAVLPLLGMNLSGQGQVIAEHRSSDPLPPKISDPVGDLYQVDQRRYGEASLVFYRWQVRS